MAFHLFVMAVDVLVFEDPPERKSGSLSLGFQPAKRFIPEAVGNSDDNPLTKVE